MRTADSAVAASYGALMRGVGLAVLLLLVAACGSGSSSPAAAVRVTVAGHVNVHDVGAYLHHCNPRDRASADDVYPGQSVTVENAAGTVVGTTQLGQPSQSGSGFINGLCVYSYSVSAPSSAFYKVQVGSASPVTFPRAKAAHADIAATFSG